MTGPAPSRRRLLGALGAGAAAALAGCGGPGADGEPRYERGDVGEINGSERNASETTAAKSVAEQEIHQGVTPLNAVTLTDHEFVFEDGYLGSTVQGTVENTGDDRIEIVEVRVRVYNDDGEQLGRYLDNTGDVDAGASWEFQVVILESPGDIAEYDITALGTPT